MYFSKHFISFITILAFFTIADVCFAGSEDSKKFEEYRKAIKDKCQIDIASFKQQLVGGEADDKPITKYSLEQILLGIQIEREHTSDNMEALEITMDHLEELPDYYTRLIEMEEEAEKELGIEDEESHE